MHAKNKKIIEKFTVPITFLALLVVIVLIALPICLDTIKIEPEKEPPKSFIETVNSIENTNYVKAFGPKKADEEDIKSIQSEVDKFKKEYKEPLGFVLLDINSNSGFAYNIDMQAFSASTIKLPYIMSLLEKDSTIFNVENANIDKALRLSDNEAYRALRDQYGVERLTQWVNELNLPKDIINYPFPSYIHPRDFLKLLDKSINVLNNSPNKKELDAMTSNLGNSSINYALGEKYHINSKPGWITGPNVSQQEFQFDGITNDIGIVHANNNPYYFVFFCEIAENELAVSPIIKQCDSVHDNMVN